jgi:hypothetical protein
MVLCGFTVVLLDADPCGSYHSEYDPLIERKVASHFERINCRDWAVPGS